MSDQLNALSGNKDTKGGSVGGMSATAKAGEFSAGTPFAASASSTPGNAGDLRGGGAAAGQFSAGPQIAAQAKSGSGSMATDNGNTVTSMPSTSPANAPGGLFGSGGQMGASTK